ncbi:HAD family hydrolase [Actinomyces sp. 2119]|uniref:HAD family hydrolase n=1 Tax=Actinomyces sp. 2119 TaxID=2321393 RepID=UPI000E6D0FE9|nr:HAD family hydrolase [Actinomyces sp. 2119]RJF44784.1 HAD family hydrolase [Actinomyces sp. 2119]
MEHAPLEPELLLPLPASVDLRLVVSDMDGTLVDGEGRVPPGFAQAVSDMRASGVTFAPASGRQLANLRSVLGPEVDDSPVIAENGALVVQGQEEIHSDTISAREAAAAITTVRDLRIDSYDVGAVLACKHCAYIERQDPAFLEQVSLYYKELEVVDDLMSVCLDSVLKVAVFDFGDVEDGSSQMLAAAVPGTQTVVSGQHWVDMMSFQVSKGRALRALQNRLGVTPEQTAVFGDYLNDLDLYEHAALGFAMRNAHPGVRAVATYVAPAHTEDGVLRTVYELLSRVRRDT